MNDETKASGFTMLKWFATLTKDQQLTVWLIVVTVALSGVCVHLYNAKEKDKIEASATLERVSGKIIQRYEIEKALIQKELKDCRDNRFQDALFFREKFFELKEQIK